MINAEDFVEAARELGFTLYAGVPCSYLKPFINYVIDDADLRYISAANEGDAVAIATGAALGGQRAVAMMQNSGLGNAVSPLTSLNHVFQLPILLIVTWRGDPRHADEPQHALMGQITTDMLEVMRIPWAYFPTRPDEIGPALARAVTFMERENRPYCLVMRKGTVAPHALRTRAAPTAPAADPQRRSVEGGDARPSRRQVLTRIMDHAPTDDSVIIASTGYTGRELFALGDRPNQLYMVGSMGCASSMALGLALVRPDLRVVVIDGDGAALMRMGNLATIGSYGDANLYHILLDNGVHDSTGGQATVSENVDFGRVAQACSYALAVSAGDADAIDAWFGAAAQDGARFLHLRIRPGAPENLPRPTITPQQVGRRLMDHITRHGA